MNSQNAASILTIVCTLSLGACSAQQPISKESAASSTNLPAADFSTLLEQYTTLTDSQRVDALEAVQSSGNTSLADRQQACYMLARLLQKSSDTKDAQRAIDLYQTASNQSALWGRCRLHIAECAALTGQEKTARDALAALMSAPDTDAGTKAAAAYALAQSYLRAGETENAQSTFKNVRQRYPKTQYATGALYYLGTIALANGANNLNGSAGGTAANGGNGSTRAGGTSVGIDYFRRYLAASPDGRFAADIVKQLTLAGPPGYTPSTADHALFAQVYYLQDNYKEALSNWVQSHSTAHFVEQAVCRLKLLDEQGAKKILLEGVHARPNTPGVVPAAQLYSRLVTRADALKIWQSILKSSPRYADVALWNLASRQDPSHALPLYRTLINKYPASKYAPESSWWLIWYQVNHGKTQPAITISQLRSALKRYGQSKAAPRFAFWIGKLQERQKQKSAAGQSYLWTKERYPSSYYGWRAQARLMALSGRGDPGWKTNSGGVTNLGGAAHSSEAANFADSSSSCSNRNWSWPDEPEQIKLEYVQAKCGYTVALLTMLRQWDEVLQIMPASGTDPVMSAWCLANLNLPLEAINAAAANIQGPPRLDARWQFAYPLLYGKLIAGSAQAKRIDPCLIHALIREESRYYSHAVSRSNALGLMQLLPSTAKLTAQLCGVRLNSTEDFFKPENNVRLGTEYLGSLLQQFTGDALAAVAAYNGGPGAVASWGVGGDGAKLNRKPSSLGHAVDPDTIVENIPIDETRDYVRKVFGSYWNYKQIYSRNF